MPARGKAADSKVDVSAYAQRLAMAPVFTGLGDDVLLAIGKHAELRPLRSGHVLWKQGSHAYELAFVWEGQLEVRRSVEGRVTYRAVKINEVIGFSNALGRAPCTVDVVASTATRVLLVPGDVLRGLVPRHPEIAFRALEYMGALVGRLSDEVEMLHHGDLEGRLIKRVRQLAEGRREVVVTHQELAEQVAARRESVTRALKKLEQRGMLVIGRGRIEIRKLGAAS
jgi:CRP/FNR family transcriptional regulator, cyclic AMP receptor protein